MKHGKVLKCMFLFTFFALAMHKTQYYICLLQTEEQTNRNILVT